MRRTVMATIAGVLFVLVVSTAAFAAVPSTTSIGYNRDTENFHGLVRSSNAECLIGRTVKVYRRTANGPELQGRTKTNHMGQWKLEVMNAEGQYFAKLKAETVMSTDCGGFRSRVIDVM